MKFLAVYVVLLVSVLLVSCAAPTGQQIERKAFMIASQSYVGVSDIVTAGVEEGAISSTQGKRIDAYLDQMGAALKAWGTELLAEQDYTVPADTEVAQ